MKSEELLTFTVLFFAVFLLSVTAVLVLLPILRRARAGQRILAIGPSWHMAKEGTPTMGGIGFILALLLGFLGYAAFLLWQGGRGQELLPAVLVVLFGFSCGVIGFLDDYLKLSKKQNEGLLAWQKFLLQLLAAAALVFVARALGLVGTAVYVPFASSSLELGFFYSPLALLFLTGVVNALNLTDGLDGLLSGTVAVVAAFFILYGCLIGLAFFVLFGVLLLGVTLGFLVFNRHPAKIFMGDTGSLFLGGLVGGVGLLSARPITVLGMGGVFVLEAVSVILQVLYFKATEGKRLFLMAPLHHHLEKRGLNENTIVAVFAVTTALLGLVMLFGG